MAAPLPQKPGLAGMPPQQQPHLPPGAAAAPGQQPMALREISPVFLCRIGQETVQDIVTRTMEIFHITRATQVLDTGLLCGDHVWNGQGIFLLFGIRLFVSSDSVNILLYGLHSSEIPLMVSFLHKVVYYLHPAVCWWNPIHPLWHTFILCSPHNHSEFARKCKGFKALIWAPPGACIHVKRLF